MSETTCPEGLSEPCGASESKTAFHSRSLSDGFSIDSKPQHVAEGGLDFGHLGWMELAHAACKFTMIQARGPCRSRRIWVQTSGDLARSSADDGFVFGAGLPSLGEQGLFRLGGEAVVDDASEVAEAGGESGFRVPGVDKCSTLPFADEGAGSLKAIELALDRIQGNGKILGDRPTIGLAVVEQGQEHRLGGLASE